MLLLWKPQSLNIIESSLMIEDLAMPQAYYSEFEFKVFSCLDKYAEGAKLCWNVLNSGNFLEVCCCFELRSLTISLWLRLQIEQTFNL